MDTPTIINLAIAIATGMTAATGLFIAIANWRITSSTVAATDVSNSMLVITNIAEAQRRVRDAKDDVAVRDFEFRELLNLLEVLALLENEGQLSPSAKKFTVQFLIEVLAHLEVGADTTDLLKQDMTSETTYVELLTFSRRHSAKIALLVEKYRKH